LLGTSDPYVKFRVGHHRAKSGTIFKNLNPIWNEVFVLKVDDVDDQLRVKVFDYDFGLKDDPMGSRYVDISNLAIGE
jgi:Ca2+-dependent lipid-binding protein